MHRGPAQSAEPQARPAKPKRGVKADLQRQPDRGARPKSWMLRRSPPLPLPARSPTRRRSPSRDRSRTASGGERTVILVTLEAESSELTMTGTIFLGGTARRKSSGARSRSVSGPGKPGARTPRFQKSPAGRQAKRWETAQAAGGLEGSGHGIPPLPPPPPPVSRL